MTERSEIEPGDPICSVTCACCGAALEITHGDEPGDVSVVGCRRNLPWCDCSALERERDEARAEVERLRREVMSLDAQLAESDRQTDDE